MRWKIQWRKWYFRITIPDKDRGWIGAAYLWPFIFVEDQKNDGIDEELEIETEKHERDHLKQQLELFLIGFWILYPYYHFTRGYENNPFELEATEWESKKEERPWFHYGWRKFARKK